MARASPAPRALSRQGPGQVAGESRPQDEVVMRTDDQWQDYHLQEGDEGREVPGPDWDSGGAGAGRGRSTSANGARRTGPSFPDHGEVPGPFRTHAEARRGRHRPAQLG